MHRQIRTYVIPAVAIALLVCGGCQREQSLSAVTADNVGTSAGGSTSADPRAPLTRDALKEAFASKSVGQVREATNTVLRSGSRAELLDFLRGVWSSDAAVTADLDAQFINEIPVRVFIGNVLAQAHANRMIQIDIEPVITVLRRGLESEDPDVVSAAMWGLEPFASNSDIDKFVAIAEGDYAPNARVAIGALAGACGDYAKQSFDRLVSNGKNEAVRAEAQGIYQSASVIRESRCRGTNR